MKLKVLANSVERYALITTCISIKLLDLIRSCKDIKAENISVSASSRVSEYTSRKLLDLDRSIQNYHVYMLPLEYVENKKSLYETTHAMMRRQKKRKESSWSDGMGTKVKNTEGGNTFLGYWLPTISCRCTHQEPGTR